MHKMPIHPALPDKLKHHLLLCGDDGVVDMRPYELASVWGVAREDTLRMFLYATRAGITNLSWHEGPPSDQEQGDALQQIPNELVFTEVGWSVQTNANPGEGTSFFVKNEGKADIVVALEKCNCDDEKVTAAKVTIMHEFRGMFSSEVLAPRSTGWRLRA